MRRSMSEEGKDGANCTEKSTQGKYPHGDLYKDRDILSNQSCSRSPPSKQSISLGWLSVWQHLLELWKTVGFGRCVWRVYDLSNRCGQRRGWTRHDPRLATMDAGECSPERIMCLG